MDVVTVGKGTQSRQSIVEKARAPDVAIRCTAPDGSICDIIAVPLEVAEGYIWAEKQASADRSHMESGHPIPLHDAVYNRIHRCVPDVELIPEEESLFGGESE
jgi:hypothetical protein